MKWTCTTCKNEHEIPNGAAWPDGCPACGGRRWMTDEVHTHTEEQIQTFATTLGKIGR